MPAIILLLLNLISCPVSSKDSRELVFADTVVLPGNTRTRQAIPDSTARFLKVNRIFIIGNRRTRDRIILRELTIKTGDVVYSADLSSIIESDQRKLYNTRLFNTVQIKPLELEHGQIDLLINLNERWYTFPAPIFELSDRNFNEWWQNYDHDLNRVNFGLRLYQFNMRGRNETLRATVQFGFQRVFNIVYRIPNMDRSQKHGLIINLEYREAKNLAYRTFNHKLEYLKADDLLMNTRAAGFTYTYRHSFYDTHSIITEYRDTEIADTVTLLNPNYLGEEKLRQRYALLAYQFLSDRRDVMQYPLHGRYFFIQLQKTGLGFDKDVNKTELFGGYARYFEFKKNIFLSNYTYGYWSAPDDQPYNLFGALGYRKQLVRGYEVYVIEGPYYFLNKTTLKKRIFSHTYRWEDWPIEQFRHIPISIYFKLYADFGVVNNYPLYNKQDINKRLSNTLLSGTGAGFDVVTSYDTVLRFEYTFNHEGKGGFFFNIKKEF